MSDTPRNLSPKPEEATSQQSEEITTYHHSEREQIKAQCNPDALVYIRTLELIAKAAVNYYRDGDIRDSRTLREALECVDWMQNYDNK